MTDSLIWSQGVLLRLRFFHTHQKVPFVETSIGLPFLLSESLKLIQADSFDLEYSSNDFYYISKLNDIARS